jgi:hypothetical protein
MTLQDFDGVNDNLGRVEHRAGINGGEKGEQPTEIS